jgi:tetratricopeptide (TPR) repeat protein
MGDDQKASFYMKKYVDLVPSDPYSHYNLGVYYLEKGIKESALEEFQFVLKFDPNFKEAYFQLGVIYHNESHVDKAIEMYKKTLELDSTFINACVNLGDLYYFEKNDAANSLYYYNKALSIDFNNKYARKMITKIQDEGKR